ncbi:Beta-1,2-xylosyltransferase 1 [Cyphellophora attinorum]|uniref:Beta-1,2-xylosyltransferase 1 n=1 Tax=Cyphellophora attinorum TaxID=1664694 RepID=A0A0N1HNV0_9EURO|nr:Beta-1,2-xylosyltransferase 1 [Phialophora attinorum]KPI36803.1 Beta-1,2-xylosyltransferase 1 [Phialophora attinorum]
MLRSRRLLFLLILLAIFATSVYLLRNQDSFEELPGLSNPLHDFTNPLRGHHAHEENPPLLPQRSLTHPIHRLITDAESTFQTVRARQSRSLADAVAEYRRRYKVPPPPHFDKWYNFAKRRGVELIDEYDTIYHALLPFWSLKPSVIRERTREAIGFDNALIAVMIRNGKVVKMDGGGEMYQWHRDATPVMLGNFIKYLPDMDLAFNIHDEPRVVVQADSLARHVSAGRKNMTLAYNSPSPRNSFSKRPSDLGDGMRIKDYRTTRFNKFAHQPTWSNSKLSCPLTSPARGCIDSDCHVNITAYSDQPLGFIRNTTAFSDICNSPSLEHIRLLRPPQRLRLSSFQDILYPSPWYYMDRVKYEPERDMPWAEKNATMYWRGSTTGGFSRDGGWRRQHRQQFLMKIQPQATSQILQYTPNTTSSTPEIGAWEVHSTPMTPYSKYFDIKFTFIGQCDPGDCDAQREYFGTTDPVNMFDAFQSRYLLDIDGNAFSGRYHAWLQSNSLVYKLAVFREWHDEWLKAWVHYVPLGLRGEEYVESVRYFEEEEGGQQEAKRIAKESKGWAEKVLRKEDLEVWYFRLLLEYGRLVDDEREDIGFGI